MPGVASNISFGRVALSEPVRKLHTLSIHCQFSLVCNIASAMVGVVRGLAGKVEILDQEWLLLGGNA